MKLLIRLEDSLSFVSVVKSTSRCQRIRHVCTDQCFNPRQPVSCTGPFWLDPDARNLGWRGRGSREWHWWHWPQRWEVVDGDTTILSLWSVAGMRRWQSSLCGGFWSHCMFSFHPLAVTKQPDRKQFRGERVYFKISGSATMEKSRQGLQTLVLSHPQEQRAMPVQLHLSICGQLDSHWYSSGLPSRKRLHTAGNPITVPFISCNFWLNLQVPLFWLFLLF